MRWNVTEVPEELAKLVKLESARLGISTRQYIIETMSGAVQSPGSLGVEARRENLVPSKPKSARNGVGSVESTLGVVAIRKGREKVVRAVGKNDASAKYPSGGESLAAISPLKTSDSNLERHDPKSCRSYKCGLCRAAGIKDSHRGL